MKRAVAAAAGLFGAVSLWWLMPRHDAALGLGRISLGRAEAIARAADWARAHGVEIRGWQFAVTTIMDPALMRIQAAYPDSVVARSFSPVRVKVLAYTSRGDAVLMTLSAGGRPLSFLDRRVRPSTPPAPAPAEEEMMRLTGADSGRFTRTAENVRTIEGSRSAWEWVDPSLPGVLARVVVVTRNGRITNSSYEFAAARAVASAPDPRPAPRTAQLILSIALMIGIAAASIWTLFSALVRRTDHLAFAARFLWIPALAHAAAFLSGSYQNGAIMASFDEGLAGDARLLQGLTLSTLLLLVPFLVLAAGYASLPRDQMSGWVPACLAARGRLWRRSVGEQIWIGIIGSPALAAIPYWLAAVTGAARIRFLEGDSLVVAAWPQLQPLDGLAKAWELYAAVVFLSPWLAARMKGAARRCVLMAAAGALLTAMFRPVLPPGHFGNLAAGALLALGYLAVYRFAGLLGVWFAPLGMYAVVQGLRLADLPAGSIRWAGWETLALFGGVAAAALIVSVAGRAGDGLPILEEMEAGASVLPRSQRERLRAEFGLARRAQQDVLPSSPPRLEGFQVAAICEPAREVGGDLYDYLPFPGGQWGLCVADVSGKGLPAALYMTLVKGMLASAALRPPRLPLIATRMNQAIARAGGRRVFVTLALAVLDPQHWRVEHIRAGHNPPLLWRASTGEGAFLQPRGIGLGLTAGPAFESNLETDTVSLAPGDVLVLYSDGLTEDMDPAGALFGQERLLAVVRRAASAGAEALLAAIIEEARRFRQGAEPHDDLTLVILRRGIAGQDTAARAGAPAA